MEIKDSIAILKPILASMLFKSIQERVDLLEQHEKVVKFLNNNEFFRAFLCLRSAQEKIVLTSMILLGQENILIGYLSKKEGSEHFLQLMLQNLIDVEAFYHDMGGLIGYHVKILELIEEKLSPGEPLKQDIHYYQPPGLEISQELIVRGIHALEEACEIYPIGGAGDRLGLTCSETLEALPAACLLFSGRTLLEGLIRDLQAKEYLFYKLYGRQITIPVALMTSHEKDNNKRIRKIFLDNNWFGRKKESFFFFIQPLVPVVTSEGKWLLDLEGHIIFKPGGHGVIWKLAKDQAVFSWFLKQGKNKALIRQINNPIAGIDSALFALNGAGSLKHKTFGFLSCKRLVGSAEGTLVFEERKDEKGYNYKITNLEYTDFKKYGVQDMPEAKESAYSLFPSNTNILFVDIEKINKICCPVPGMLVNMKKVDKKESYACRLESTMQNIADYIENSYPEPKEKKEEYLDTFIVYNERYKTISVTKNSYIEGGRFLETPENAFYDLLKNNRELLEKECGMQILCKPQGIEDYLTFGPSLLFIYHPALGPLYSICKQKLRKGIFYEGAELQLEIVEVDIENIDIDGSLLISSDCVLGKEVGNLLHYDDQFCGRCTLRNVKIRNLGRKRKGKHAWKNRPERKGALEIKLYGNCEFVAENVTFSDSQTIIVEDGQRVVAYEKNGLLCFKVEKLNHRSPYWRYTLKDKEIILEKLT